MNVIITEPARKILRALDILKSITPSPTGGRQTAAFPPEACPRRGGQVNFQRSTDKQFPKP